VEAGAWVWDDVKQGLRASGVRPLRTQPGAHDRCVAMAEGRSGRIVASLKVTDCVGLQALAREGATGGK